MINQIYIIIQYNIIVFIKLIIIIVCEIVSKEFKLSS